MAGTWKDITGFLNSIYQSVPAVLPRKEIEKVIIKEVEMVHFRGTFIRLAGFSGALSVIMAAYGSHGFDKSDINQQLKRTYEIGNKMHMIHSVALLASPMTRKPVLVGSLLTAGILLFSGSCYYHALTGNLMSLCQIVYSIMASQAKISNIPP
nr:transmembrane protein 256-like protein [Pomacea canaliculata]